MHSTSSQQPLSPFGLKRQHDEVISVHFVGLLLVIIFYENTTPLGQETHKKRESTGTKQSVV
jgi:hypothetical protein